MTFSTAHPQSGTINTELSAVGATACPASNSPRPAAAHTARDTDNDSFEAAVAALSVAYAHRRRGLGYACHRVVPDITVKALAGLLPGLLDALVGQPIYEAVRAVQGRIERLAPADCVILATALAADAAVTPWRPVPGAQSQAFELASHVDVLGLLGGAGSGKTDVAVFTGLYQGRVTRILRQTSMEFSAILKRVGEVVGTTDGRNLSTNSWTLPAPFGHGAKGCTLEWVGLNDADAVLKLQGRPADVLIPEDSANGALTREDIAFASRWLRSTEPGLHKRVIYTCNPPTSNAGLWVRDFFAPWVDPAYEGTPARSGEILYFLPNNDGTDGEHEVPQGTPGAQSRSVVLSTVDDNPRLLRTGYKQQLQSTATDVLRRRLLLNDWSAGFDSDDAMQVIPSAWVEAAMQRWTPMPPAALDALGVDVSRGGKDKTAIAARCQDWLAPLKVLSGIDTATGQQVAAAVLAARGSSRHAVTFIDVGGVGASPYDILREKVHTVGVNFGEGTKALDNTGSFGYFNVRSMLWWQAREALDPANGRKIALPPDRQLKAELCMPRYELRGGKLFVESRDDIIKRIKRSPDLATAVILALIPTNSSIARGGSSLLRAMLRHQASHQAQE